MAWSGEDDRRNIRPRDAGPTLEAVGARLWPFVLTVFFGILFAGIADLAWLTAIGTTLPWFTSGISAQVYTATLTTATIATLILASLAANKLALLDARARAVLRRARGLVWQTVAGPLAMFLVFISIAGAMLPGSGAFAQTHYQLNTGLVLFLGYGWPFLVAWTVAAIALLHVLIRPDAFD